MALSFLIWRQWFVNQLEAVSQHPLACSLLFFPLLFILFLNRLREGKAVNPPPSPPKLPIIGHLHHLGTLPHRSLQALSRKYGPLMLLNLGQIPTLVVQSAEMAKEIMKTHDIVFANRPSIKASRVLLYDGKDISFAPYGEYWRQMRKLCVLDLLSAKRVESFRFVREDEIVKMVSKINHSCSMSKEVNLSDLVITVTNNVMSRVALGRSLEGEWGKSVYADVMKEGMKLFGYSSVEDTFPSLRWIDVLTGLDGRMKRTSKIMHQFVDEVIEEHLSARKDKGELTDRKDFIDMILDYEQESKLAGVEFTRENFTGVVLDMFAAGTDTAYTTVEWAMAELLNHPNVMRKLQEEVRRVVGMESKVDESKIKEMNYLNCVIKETLRLRPPVVFVLPRESSAATTIDGYYVPAKTRVIINAWAIARDPKKWEKPDEFIPERFINNSVDFRGVDFEYIPFGAGRRGCPGIAFGVTSVESILANLLHWFDWELPGGKSTNAVDMTEVFGLTVHLKSPLRLVPITHTF